MSDGFKIAAELRAMALECQENDPARADRLRKLADLHESGAKQSSKTA